MTTQKKKNASRKNIKKAIDAHVKNSKHNGKDTDNDNR